MIILGTMCCTLQAQEAAQLWSEAAQQYQREDYAAAIKIYQSLEGSNPSDELYYNMGNCYYQLDSIAAAILYFERALKVNPRMDEAEENLKLARARMDDPIIAIDEFFLLSWIRSISNGLPPLVWGILLIGSLWTVSWLYVNNFRKKIDVKLRYKIISLGVVLMIAGLGYMSYHELKREDLAVLRYDSDLHIAPDPQSQIVRSLEGGEKLHVLDSLDAYLKVRLVNFEVGWIDRRFLEEI